MQSIRFHPDDKLVVLTGAGISAESGVRTFRDNNGLWENHRIEDVATPEAFARNPALVWRFYEERRMQLKTVGPNPAHTALARLEARLGPERFLLITQNVDDLHERGGSRQVLHLHGELLKVRCTRCKAILHTDAPLVDLSVADIQLPRCDCGGIRRPHIVWFGEMPFEMDRIERALLDCTHFLAIGTSGVVYPAAAFLGWARQSGAKTHGINLEPPENHRLFEQFHVGKAGEIVPGWVDSLKIED